MICKLVNAKGTHIITDLITSISWGGDTKNVAREVNITYLYSTIDTNIPQVDIQCGNMIILEENSKELFRGYVFSRDKSRESEEVNIKVYDGLIYIIKNMETYNFKKSTTKQIVSRICKDFGISVGNVIDIGNITQLFLDKTLYDIIMTSYKLADANGKYMMKLSNNKLDIYKQGTTTCTEKITEDTNLVSSTYGESIENLINRVKVIDDKGKILATYSNNEDIKSYGVLQTLYRKQEDEKIEVAKSQLKGIERTANLVVLGNVEYISGNKVLIEDKYTGLNGAFIIVSDKHDWNDGKYTTELKLYFEGMEG